MTRDKAKDRVVAALEARAEAELEMRVGDAPSARRWRHEAVAGAYRDAALMVRRAFDPTPDSGGGWRPIELDLSKADGHEHPDFNETDYFIAQIHGILRFGRMQKVWFGWHFSCGFGASGGLQFDAPGSNGSNWERVWRLPAPPSQEQP